MKTAIRTITALVCALAALLPVSAIAKEKPVPVTFPAGARHDAWDALLKKYVNERGLVAYEKWKASDADRKALTDYLGQFAAAPAKPAAGNDLAASAINAYNAFAIHWILENYPTESIQALPDSFSRKAHAIGGAKVALDDIEHGTMRPLLGYRAHAPLVCCARSCPPLQRTACTAAGLDAQIDGAELARDLRVAGALRVCEAGEVQQRLGPRHAHELRDADVGVIQLRRALHGEHADEGAPREAGEIHLPLAQRAAEVPREFDGFAGELLGIHRRGRDVGAVGFARAARIPPRAARCADARGRHR